MVLTIADMQHHLPPASTCQAGAIDPHDYREPIARRMKQAARAVADRSGLGCTFAEAFRRTRYGGIESLAKDQQIPEDV
jgi:hypothetical protein